MSKDNVNYGWNYFEDIYENVMKKNITFSNEMGEHIKKEIQKMYEQREEWLKNNRQKKKEDDTGTISKSIENQ